MVRGSEPVTPEPEDLRWFAREVAEQRCMPLLYRLAARIDPFPRGFLVGSLRAFLVSRWDLIEDHPDPRRWAEEFVRVGGPTRLACRFFLFLCAEMMVVFAVSWARVYVGDGGENMHATENDARGWCSAAVGPGLTLVGIIGCVVYFRLRRDWLRR
jgi:hypothetical protein